MFSWLLRWLNLDKPTATGAAVEQVTTEVAVVEKPKTSEPPPAPREEADRDTHVLNSQYRSIRPFVPAAEVPKAVVAADLVEFEAIPAGDGKTAPGDCRPTRFPNGAILEVVQKREGVVMVRCYVPYHYTNRRWWRPEKLMGQIFLMPTERFCWLAQQKYPPGHWALRDYRDEVARRQAQGLLDYINLPPPGGK